jgi:NADH dehydrogenase [ubiquinone] 1 alpha subcomplex assembly factor 7
VPGFHATLDLHLVETSEPLRAAQRTALAAFAPTWHERLDDVPAGPLLLVANEFFDALPVRQFHRTAEGWRERMVGLAPDGALRLALAPGLTPFAAALPEAPVGAEAEISEAGRALAAVLGARLRRDGGWALIIDYGHDRPSLGASLQAVRSHRGADLLDRPGETDLSAHVDFEALAAAAAMPSFGPASQGDFLRRLGILERAQSLKRQASPDQARAIDAALARLIAPDQMGTLFRVLAVGDTRSAAPAGFSDTPSDKT